MSKVVWPILLNTNEFKKKWVCDWEVTFFHIGLSAASCDMTGLDIFVPRYTLLTMKAVSVFKKFQVVLSMRNVSHVIGMPLN